MIYPSVPFESFVHSTDGYGQKVLRPHTKGVCCIVKLHETSANSTIRADGSATRGNAMETSSVSVFLVRPNVVLQMDSKVVIDGVELRVASIRRRYTATGKFDHFEIWGESWVA